MVDALLAANRETGILFQQPFEGTRLELVVRSLGFGDDAEIERLREIVLASRYG